MTNYWEQFTPTVSFLEPCVVEGAIEELSTFKTNDGPVPRIRIRMDSRRVVWVQAAQTRLMEQLVAKAPGVGDRVRIVYHGESDRAAPGYSKTKEFTVEVQRKVSRPSTGPGPRGGPENGAGAGK